MSVTERQDTIAQPIYPPASRSRRLTGRLPRLDAAQPGERAQAALLYGGFLVVLAAVLRFAGMQSEPFWHDEITMLNIGLGGWDELVRQFSNGRPPLFVFIGVVWTALFGTGEIVSRLPSYFAAVASVGVLFQLGSWMFNQRVGFLAALIMTLTEFHIYYAQTYRYYAVYVLMVLLSFYFFYALFKRRRRSDAVLYLLFTALAVYTHAHGVFAIASQGLCFLVMMVLRPDWRTRRAFFTLVGVQLVLLILIAPALWQYFLRDFLATQPIASVVGAVPDSEVGMGWLQVPSIGSIARALVRFLFFEWYYLNAFTILTAILFVFAATALYAARSGMSNWLEAVRQLPPDIAARVRSHLAEHVLTFFWCVGMIMLPWVLSFLVMPMFFDRYVLGAAPALYLLLAVAAVGIRRIIPAKLIAAGFVILLLPGLYAFYAYPDNEDWRSLASYVSEHAGPDDAIVILTSDVHLRQTYEAFHWYSRHESAVCELYEDKLDNPETLAGLSACLEGRERAWLVGLRWMGDIERLAAAGRSPDLHEFFARFQGGQWRLETDADRPSFYLLGMYIYEKE